MQCLSPTLNKAPQPFCRIAERKHISIANLRSHANVPSKIISRSIPSEIVKAADASYAITPDLPQEPRISEGARRALQRATGAVKRYGWISFWIQLSLSIVSGIILLFSVAFTSQSGPKSALYLTLLGILAGFLSTFWNFGYTRTAMKMQKYLDLAAMGRDGPKVKKQQVIDMITKGMVINLVGLGSTLLGHFLSMCCALWLLNVVGEGKGLRFQSEKESAAAAIPGTTTTVRGNAGMSYKIKTEE